VYLAFNVFSGYAAAYFGASPPSYYLLPILALTPPWAWVGLYFAARTERPRVSAPVLAALLYLAVIAATPHKESRFVYPALALLVMTAAPALIDKLRSLPAQRSEAAFAAALVLGLLPLLWPPSDLKDVRGDQFRAIVRATRDADATGLLIVGEGIWGSGGYFYVGKNIPGGVADWPQDANFQGAIRNPRVNRVVTIDGRGVPELQQAGFRVVGQIGRESILSR
jgi:GPI mannosyltransferase 3